LRRGDIEEVSQEILSKADPARDFEALPEMISLYVSRLISDEQSLSP
jgi:hypothetical protein